MGLLSAHLELKYASALNVGVQYLTDSSYAITIPDGIGITEYNSKTLLPNLNDFSRQESRIEITNVTTFLSIQTSRMVGVDIYTDNSLNFRSLTIDRLFLSVSPFYKVVVTNRDLANKVNLKIMFA